MYSKAYSNSHTRTRSRTRTREFVFTLQVCMFLPSVVPYYVCFEFMPYGTLKDLVWTKFAKTSEGPDANSPTLRPVTTDLMKQTRELIRLASQIVDAMVFLSSQTVIFFSVTIVK